jgi:outer membrane protein assembly factor BamB
MTDTKQALLALLAIALPLSGTAGAQDWPMWGRDPSRNMATDVRGLPASFVAGRFIGATDEIDFATTKNVKWIAKLGSQSYGNPSVAEGKVFVGTNNDWRTDPRYPGDRCVLLCLDEATGELNWQLSVPKLGTGKVSDWEYLGICSSPAVEDGRVYVLTNRCEVMCLDADGLADGNDGPFTTEAEYLGVEQLVDTDADIIWSMNMIDECEVFPHNITAGSVLIAGDVLLCSTSNGVDYGHVETPAPFAPSMIMVDKATGELLAEEASGTGERIFHSNWTSPALLTTDDEQQIIFGGPDGWVYSFAMEPVEGPDGWPILDEIWRFDANPPEYRVDPEGNPRRYATHDGPSEVLGTPITWDGRVYALIGQDPEHGSGLGNMVCIDPSGEGDVTASHEVWSYSNIKRSLSTMAIAGGLLFATDFSGFVYCLDALTGEELWVHDTLGHIWASPLVTDGRVFVGNADGYCTILPATREYDEALVVEIDMTSPIFASPIAANGVLYMASHTHLFAIAQTEEAESEPED